MPALSKAVGGILFQNAKFFFISEVFVAQNQVNLRSAPQTIEVIPVTNILWPS
ncbi:MAG: hypothetical protein ACI97K_001831 [Glaciecola sp.]|jgi:hypothetical protein